MALTSHILTILLLLCLLALATAHPADLVSLPTSLPHFLPFSRFTLSYYQQQSTLLEHPQSPQAHNLAA
jgi:hypothetical protein